MTRVSVSLGLWLDRPAEEVLATARIADECGYPELWVGEMATFDAFALATAIGATTAQIHLTVGPLAVPVRDPVMIAMGAASVAHLTGRRCGVALGTSSRVVVEDWHGRSRARPARTLRESAQACRQLLSGDRVALDGANVTAKDYRLRLPVPGGPLTVAAFGSAAIGAAAALADRMVVNLVSVEALVELRSALEGAARRAARPTPALAVWIPTAVDPTDAAIQQLRRALVPYLAAPGYAEMFERCGGAGAVALARSHAHPREQLAAVSDELLTAITAIGSSSAVDARFDAYAAAGADEIVIVPAATVDDPAGAVTLRALAGKGAVHAVNG